MSDLITRTLQVQRDDRTTEHVFTTFASVFDPLTVHHTKNGQLLAHYLRECFIMGEPHHRASVSAAPELVAKIVKVDSDLIELAQKAEYHKRQQWQHTIVQKYLLDNDPCTLATEAPVWNEHFLGHIDLLRVLDSGIIQVADFKPEAHREKKAASQVYRYATMLAAKLLLPLDAFDAVYFDDRNCYKVIL